MKVVWVAGATKAQVVEDTMMVPDVVMDLKDGSTRDMVMVVCLLSLVPALIHGHLLRSTTHVSGTH
jgi:hypothetical protein